MSPRLAASQPMKSHHMPPSSSSRLFITTCPSPLLHQTCLWFTIAACPELHFFAAAKPTRFAGKVTGCFIVFGEQLLTGQRKRGRIQTLGV